MTALGGGGRRLTQCRQFIIIGRDRQKRRRHEKFGGGVNKSEIDQSRSANRSESATIRLTGVN